MKRSKLTTVLSATAVIVTVGAGTAVANGALSRDSADRDQAVAAGLSH